jgi:opacity protein-like surface antigen
MNGFKVTSSIGLLLASTACFSLNPAQGWYVGMVGGGTYAPKIDFKLKNPIDHKNNKSTASYLFGGNGGAMLGYRLCNFRLEFEALVNDNKLQQLKVGEFTFGNQPNKQHVRVSGYTYFISGLVNGIYEFYQPESERTNFVPYLGLGLGYANLQSKQSFEKEPLYSASFNLDTITESRSAGIAQAILGLNYFMDDFAAVGIDYRYMIISKSGYATNYFQPQTINLSFTYAFGK